MLGSQPHFPQRQSNGLWSSFSHAVRGLIHTVLHQRNMRIHVVAGILVGLVGSGIPLGLAEKVTLIFCVLFVLFAEILNSALEQLVDLAVQQFDDKAKVTKDAASAGVLVLTIGTVVIFAAILVHNWETVAASQGEIVRQVILGTPLATCAAILMMARAKSWALDIGLFLTGLLLWGAVSLNSKSYVFSAMTLGLFLLAAAAARERHLARP